MGYEKVRDLKYGINPHQKPAEVGARNNVKFPGEFINGNPGTVNTMELLRSMKLVTELDRTFDMPAAAAFKHINPAGAAIAVPLDVVLKRMYFCEDVELSGLSLAYLRADGTDPKSAYGGTVALSRKVDVPTANAIKPRVVDVVVAPDYEPDALAILKKKKDGKMVIAKYDQSYVPPSIVSIVEDDFEFKHERNNYAVTDALLEDVIGKPLSEEEKRDLKVGIVIAKYTKSNKTIYTLDGQSTGIMPCQQSRVDSMRWAGDKSVMWLLRQIPHFSELKGPKIYDTIQLQTDAVENLLDSKDGSDAKSRKAKVREVIQATLEQRGLPGFRAVTCGFLPFADCVVEAHNHHVGTILYPKVPSIGVRFKDVKKTAEELNIKLCLFPYRLFVEN
jgi:AICAR transformylase/IMP cyclohydrolase PurH